MNSPTQKEEGTQQDLKQDPDHNSNSGPNLIIAYSLVALGLLSAIGIAMMIVYPFYLRR